MVSREKMRYLLLIRIPEFMDFQPEEMRHAKKDIQQTDRLGNGGRISGLG
jgi:hypothetical protein